jgi:hypothetical protein
MVLYDGELKRCKGALLSAGRRSNHEAANSGKDCLCVCSRQTHVHDKRQEVSRAAMTRNQTRRTITEIRLRDDTQPSDFRVPLPGTTEAITKGCTCPPQPKWPMIAFASDCPLHLSTTAASPP